MNLTEELCEIYHRNVRLRQKEIATAVDEIWSRLKGELRARARDNRWYNWDYSSIDVRLRSFLFDRIDTAGMKYRTNADKQVLHITW